MGISLSNKDYIAFTIKEKKKKNERKKEGHDYDAIADYNKKQIIKQIIKKRTEKGGNKKEKKKKNET